MPARWSRLVCSQCHLLHLREEWLHRSREAMLKSCEILALFDVQLVQTGFGMRLILPDIRLRFIQILLEPDPQLSNFGLQFLLTIS